MNVIPEGVIIINGWCIFLKHSNRVVDRLLKLQRLIELDTVHNEDMVDMFDSILIKLCGGRYKELSTNGFS